MSAYVRRLSSTITDTITSHELALLEKHLKKDKIVRNLEKGTRKIDKNKCKVLRRYTLDPYIFVFFSFMFLSLALFSLSFSPTLLPPLFLSGCLFLSLIHVALIRTLSTVVVVLIHPFVYIRFYLSHFLFFLLCPVSLPPSFSLSVSRFLSRSVLRCKAEETPAVVRSFSKVLLSLSRAKNTPAQSSEGVPCQRNTGIRTTKAVNVDLELSWNDFQEWHVIFDG